MPDSSNARLGDLSAHISTVSSYVAPASLMVTCHKYEPTLPGYHYFARILMTRHTGMKKLITSETSWFSHNIARKIYMRNPKYAQVGKPILGNRQHQTKFTGHKRCLM